VTAATLADWAAFSCLGLSLSAAGAIPVVLWVDADYLLVDDWQAAGDRLLVETTRARDFCRDAAALVILLTTSPEAAR
jgi:hypothetical protein